MYCQHGLDVRIERARELSIAQKAHGSSTHFPRAVQENLPQAPVADEITNRSTNAFAINDASSCESETHVVPAVPRP